jgi:hypothetical protein
MFPKGTDYHKEITITLYHTESWQFDTISEANTNSVVLPTLDDIQRTCRKGRAKVTARQSRDRGRWKGGQKFGQSALIDAVIHHTGWATLAKPGGEGGATAILSCLQSNTKYYGLLGFPGADLSSYEQQVHQHCWHLISFRLHRVNGGNYKLILRPT